MYTLCRELNGENRETVLRYPWWVAKKRLSQIQSEYKKQKEEANAQEAKMRGSTRRR